MTTEADARRIIDMIEADPQLVLARSAAIEAIGAVTRYSVAAADRLLAADPTIGRHVTRNNLARYLASQVMALAGPDDVQAVAVLDLAPRLD